MPPVPATTIETHNTSFKTVPDAWAQGGGKVSTVLKKTACVVGGVTSFLGGLGGGAAAGVAIAATPASPFVGSFLFAALASTATGAIAKRFTKDNWKAVAAGATTGIGTSLFLSYGAGVTGALLGPVATGVGMTVVGTAAGMAGAKACQMGYKHSAKLRDEYIARKQAFNAANPGADLSLARQAQREQNKKLDTLTSSIMKELTSPTNKPDAIALPLTHWFGGKEACTNSEMEAAIRRRIVADVEKNHKTFDPETCTAWKDSIVREVRKMDKSAGNKVKISSTSPISKQLDAKLTLASLNDHAAVPQRLGADAGYGQQASHTAVPKPLTAASLTASSLYGQPLPADATASSYESVPQPLRSPATAVASASTALPAAHPVPGGAGAAASHNAVPPKFGQQHLTRR